jgi:predicted nucleic acid-binding protein
MMLLDSSVWIEHLTAGPRTAGKEELFERPEDILVSAINLFEVGRYVLRTSGQAVMEDVLLHMEECQVVSVDAQVGRVALELATTSSLHMADALIAATALLHGATLVTLDAELLALPGSREP